MQRIMLEAMDASIDSWLNHKTNPVSQAVSLGNEKGTPLRSEIACGLFLQAFTHLLARFGLPDYPGSETDWREVLGVHSLLLAVWDFDYYQLSLSATLETAKSGDKNVVVLAHHVLHTCEEVH